MKFNVHPHPSARFCSTGGGVIFSFPTCQCPASWESSASTHISQCGMNAPISQTLGTNLCIERVNSWRSVHSLATAPCSQVRAFGNRRIVFSYKTMDQGTGKLHGMVQTLMELQWTLLACRVKMCSISKSVSLCHTSGTIKCQRMASTHCKARGSCSSSVLQDMMSVSYLWSTSYAWSWRALVL